MGSILTQKSFGFLRILTVFLPIAPDLQTPLLHSFSTPGLLVCLFSSSCRIFNPLFALYLEAEFVSQPSTAVEILLRHHQIPALNQDWLSSGLRAAPDKCVSLFQHPLQIRRTQWDSPLAVWVTLGGSPNHPVSLFPRLQNGLAVEPMEGPRSHGPKTFQQYGVRNMKLGTGL